MSDLRKFRVQEMDDFNKYAYAHRVMGIQDRERMQRMNGHPQLKLPQNREAEPDGGWKEPVYIGDQQKRLTGWEMARIDEQEHGTRQKIDISGIDKGNVRNPIRLVEADGKESFFPNMVEAAKYAGISKESVYGLFKRYKDNGVIRKGPMAGARMTMISADNYCLEIARAQKHGRGGYRPGSGKRPCRVVLTDPHGEKKEYVSIARAAESGIISETSLMRLNDGDQHQLTRGRSKGWTVRVIRE